MSREKSVVNKEADVNKVVFATLLVKQTVIFCSKKVALKCLLEGTVWEKSAVRGHGG